MEGQRVGETGLSESAGPSNQNTHFHPSPNPFFNQGGSAFDFGELEEAIVLRGVKDIGHDEPKSSAAAAAAALFSSSSRAATLEMFPAWPIRFRHTTLGSGNSGESTESESTGVNTIREPGDSSISKSFSFNNQQEYNHQQQIEMASTADRYKVTTTTTTSMGNTSQHQKSEGTTRSGKVLDAKMLRRLAQNREAARKSRLRKKAYVQQLESSRMKLAQLEQELQRARSQGLFLGGGGGGQPASMSSGATIFDMEYGRWVEEEHRQMAELRTALQSHLIDSELRGMVDSYISHYDDVFRLKAVAAKSDVFHLISGMWTSPAERCFLWIGGFRPSDLIKMLVGQLEPLTEQQLMGIYNLQHSSQQAEEALSQGLEQLQQSLVDTIATTTLTDGMHHMAIALGKLSNLEGLLRQADNLREQTLHQLRRILTTRQAARCMLVIGEYYGRLRALSSLWASRPRETLMSDSNTCPAGTDLQMVPQPHNHFPNF